jgi:tRNA G18 (ribose-2'-O)-methylase SpoU
MSRGFFAIGIERGKTGHNLGTLWRAAFLYQADFIFTVGARYRADRDCGSADTVKAWKSIPLMHFDTVAAFAAAMPFGAPLVGVELTPQAISIARFKHPERAVYVLGAEDNGISREMQDRCHRFVQLPGTMSMNVACAGTVVMHDRWHKLETAYRPEAAE